MDLEQMIEQAERDLERMSVARIGGDSTAAKMRRLIAYAEMERKCDELQALKARRNEQ